MHNSSISKELLSRAKLLKASDFQFSLINTNDILNELFSIGKSKEIMIVSNF
jgi:hypothetical protein